MGNFKKLTSNELINLLQEYNHKEIHIHHTWRPSHEDFNGNNHQDLQGSMYNYHVNTLSWSDIGQHVTLFPDGTFLTGRDFGRNPASIRGYNDNAFAVEMLGNFDTGNDVLDGEQLTSIINLCNYFYTEGKYVRFHRENSGKTCPGTSIDKDNFMALVKSYNVSNVSNWAKTAYKWVTESGISDGSRPKDVVTREELWVMLHRLNNVNK